MTRKREMQLDWLAETTLEVIAASRPELHSWCSDRKVRLQGLDRLKVLWFIVDQLDAENQEIVCEHLNIAHGDLIAAKRVLQRI